MDGVPFDDGVAAGLGAGLGGGGGGGVDLTLLAAAALFGVAAAAAALLAGGGGGGILRAESGVPVAGFEGGSGFAAAAALGLGAEGGPSRL